MAKIPSNQHITYQLQFRKCGKTSCSTCRNGQGHGPYWYAYWREDSRLRSGYVGKQRPEGAVVRRKSVSPADTAQKEQIPARVANGVGTAQTQVVAPALV
ncbi:MAG: hypothetical protein IMW89_19310 [Ktedonobacteraceae bacterium]|nr:hypothetical protein [Ktedonobacteraceae bacterium]